VKSDRQAARTGNVFVEYRQPPGRSGIAVSTADWRAIEVGGLAWVLVERARLLALARRAYREGRRVKGGDYDRTEGVLVPVEWLVRPTRKQTGPRRPLAPAERARWFALRRATGLLAGLFSVASSCARTGERG
jgi:hypothetical protein